MSPPTVMTPAEANTLAHLPGSDWEQTASWKSGGSQMDLRPGTAATAAGSPTITRSTLNGGSTYRWRRCASRSRRSWKTDRVQKVPIPFGPRPVILSTTRPSGATTASQSPARSFTSTRCSRRNAAPATVTSRLQIRSPPDSTACSRSGTSFSSCARPTTTFPPATPATLSAASAAGATTPHIATAIPPSTFSHLRSRMNHLPDARSILAEKNQRVHQRLGPGRGARLRRGGRRQTRLSRI